MSGDAALIRSCLAGDEEAWRSLVHRYRRLIYSIPVAHRLPADQADEVFQRVCLKLVENLSRLRKVESLASWLGTVTRRECTALLRRAARELPDPEEFLLQLEDASLDAEQGLAAIEQEHAVRLALEELDEPCRSLLEALYVEQPRPSYEEISRRLSRPVGSLGPTRARCLKKLAGKLRGVGPGERK
ncbi:MAG: sigma-70 family RNA polymerase sigma factor [Acidobacteriota bacterium]|nr:sigma-70 family RNA polymerase sigma factor [Acidobacteriota bacterium]MDQ7087001.1 sigma-70 family RNA polymerase sigma factor [Acidobacteriota bacterium]